MGGRDEETGQEGGVEPKKARPEFRIGGVVFDFELTVVIFIGILLPMLHFYGRNPTNLFQFYEHTPAIDRALNQFILFFLVPMAIVVGLFRERPSAYGVGLGNWRQGLLWLAVVCPIIAVSLWFIMGHSDLQEWYLKRQEDTFATLVLWNGLELFGWEFLCRGLWLFGLARALGPGPAIFLQVVPFAFLHMGKVEIEALSTLLSGPAFGFVAWKCQSFLYAWLIHWFMLVLTIWLAMNATA